MRRFIRSLKVSWFSGGGFTAMRHPPISVNASRDGNSLLILFTDGRACLNTCYERLFG